MNLALSNGEQLVKSWEYGKYKGLIFTKGTCTLAVTNKRIIVVMEGKKETTRDDYDLKNIKSVSAGFKYKRRFFIFKRGSLDLSFATDLFDVVSVVGLSAIKAKGSFLSRIPLIGRLFGGGKTKVKVDVNAAKDIVQNISSMVLTSAASEA